MLGPSFTVVNFALCVYGRSDSSVRMGSVARESVQSIRLLLPRTQRRLCRRHPQSSGVQMERLRLQTESRRSHKSAQESARTCRNRASSQTHDSGSFACSCDALCPDVCKCVLCAVCWAVDKPFCDGPVDTARISVGFRPVVRSCHLHPIFRVHLQTRTDASAARRFQPWLSTRRLQV
jgi:hypothetical protein